MQARSQTHTDLGTRCSSIKSRINKASSRQPCIFLPPSSFPSSTGTVRSPNHLRRYLVWVWVWVLVSVRRILRVNVQASACTCVCARARACEQAAPQVLPARRSRPVAG